ncbi:MULTISPECIES: hypothetical protein [unclassified Brenneria]|uniref:hypothetical protein n=1 Tax=unclassified Brenneria TaxID=2634434 RepID=UPI0029C222E0|nr:MULTISPECIES: hypothetical protein [unclassified Brenneria]MDX5630813.1 hypothetical protein [Brenneria sp. L3-3Z]MDX5697895.1 hypothetical protein [Brenneria sp. L4-2C]
MSIQTAFYPGELPELTLTGDELAQAGFTAGTLLRLACTATGWCWPDRMRTPISPCCWQSWAVSIVRARTGYTITASFIWRATG